MDKTAYHMPHLVRVAIDNYVELHREPGGFTTAVLENDLRGAIGRADPFSMDALKDIVMYCHWEIPGNCWGSREVVRAWLEAGNEESST